MSACGLRGPRKLLAVVGPLLLVLAGLAWYGYVEYRARMVPDAVLPHVKNASLRLENSLAYEIESTQITYRELFDTLSKHVTELDSRVIDVQTLETRKNAPRMQPLLRYMKAIQETLRSQEMTYRKQLALSVALESSSEAYRDMRGTTSYGFDYARRSAERASERVSKANTELQEAKASFRGTLERLGVARSSVVGVPSTLLFDPALVPKVIEKFAKGGGA
jgi:hypothetical protein